MIASEQIKHFWTKSTAFIHFSCYGVSKLQRKDGFIWFSCNIRPFERDQEPVPCISQLPYYGYPKVHKELLSRNRLASLTSIRGKFPCVHFLRRDLGPRLSFDHLQIRINTDFRYSYFRPMFGPRGERGYSDQSTPPLRGWVQAYV